MSRYSNLANLLEQAAKALREADDALDRIMPTTLDRPLPMGGRGKGGFSKRATAAIVALGVKTVGELAQVTADQVASIRMIGMTTVWEISDWLAERGLTFKGGPPFK